MMIRNYKTFVFDCDGVILNSNEIKTKAFYRACLPYGEEAALAMKDYHIKNGGISRYKKFAYFLEELVPNYSSLKNGPSLDGLLKMYAEEVYKGLLECEVTPRLQELREQTSNSRWLVVSGGDQAELRQIFTERKLLHLFDGGIFGSPDTKDEILSRECGNGNIETPALFLGDSIYDYKAARTIGLEFIFISGWSEVRNDERQNMNCRKISKVEQLIRSE